MAQIAAGWIMIPLGTGLGVLHTAPYPASGTAAVDSPGAEALGAAVRAAATGGVCARRHAAPRLPEELEPGWYRIRKPVGRRLGGSAEVSRQLSAQGRDVKGPGTGTHRNGGCIGSP